MKYLELIVCMTIGMGFQSYGAINRQQAIIPKREVHVELTEKEQKWLKAHPQVRWGIDPKWPPFSSFNRKEELEGIDADITRLVAERVGLHLVFTRATSWSEVFQKAKAGEIDFLSGTASSAERLESFLYTEDYCSFPIVFVTRDTAPFYTLAAEIKSMTLAQARDDIITRQLEIKFPTIRLTLTNSAEEALRFVSSGKVDGTFQNLAVATRIVRINGLTNLKISGVAPHEFPLRFAVRKDSPELVSILNKGLATITEEEAEIIYATHLTPDIAKARDWSMWRRRALYSLLIGIFVAGILILWNRYLVSQIRYRKATEAALREIGDRLEQRTKDLALRVGEVERLNFDLQIVNEDLEAFSSSTSHDLRGPLRRMTMFARLICEEEGNHLTEQSQEWLRILCDEAKYMDKLIYDLLEFARIGRVELHKEPVDMTQLVHQVIEKFQLNLEKRDVVWTVGNLKKVYSDPDLLRYALTNLIDNALKYTRHCSKTQIKIDRLPDDLQSHESVFYIQDNGCGFDGDKAGALFSPFQRLHSPEEYEGTGIGLANTKKIIQKHGGRIWYESQEDKGATFFFTLPIPRTFEALHEEVFATS